MQRAAQSGEAAVSDISKLLHAWSEGDQNALERLTPVVYDELHRLARRYMRRERPGHSLQTTALVNEAYTDGGQQSFGARRQTRVGVDELYPRSVPIRRPASGFLIGEAGEPSQVTPVGAGQVASIDMRQVPACGSGQHRFQGRGAEANPSLQMAGAGLQQHARVMSVGTHELYDCGIRTIQVNQNVACVVSASVGLDVHVASLAVANAQKPDGGCTHHLRRRPKPFSWELTACLLVNQSDQIQLVGHRRELSPDRLPRQKEPEVVHDRNFAIEATRRTMNFQRTANSVLTVCLTSGGRFKYLLIS